MKRSPAIGLTILWLGLTVAAGTAAGDRPGPITFRTRTMGTVASLTLVAADSASVADLAYRALVSLQRTDSLLTNWTETSEVARVNRLAGHTTVTLDPELNDVLTVAGQVGLASDGAFDITVEPLVRLWGFLGGTPTVPDPQAIAGTRERVGWRLVAHDPQAGTVRFARPDTRIDLGGIAKGYGVDRVAAILRQAGVRDALVDLSGNMVALGAPPGKTAWTLGIMDPRDQAAYLGSIRLRDAAVATSGNYFQYVMNPHRNGPRRYGHILDPRTGWPADGMASASVIAPDATTADAWATAMIVLDADRARQLAREHPELKVVLVEQPRTGQRRVVWVEDALRPDFRLHQSAHDSVTVRYF